MKRKSKHLLDDVRFEMVPLSRNSEGKLIGGFTEIEVNAEKLAWNIGCQNDCEKNSCVNIFCKNDGCGKTTITPTTLKPTTSIPLSFI